MNLNLKLIQIQLSIPTLCQTTPNIVISRHGTGGGGGGGGLPPYDSFYFYAVL